MAALPVEQIGESCFSFRSLWYDPLPITSASYNQTPKVLNSVDYLQPTTAGYKCRNRQSRRSSLPFEGTKPILYRNASVVKRSNTCWIACKSSLIWATLLAYPGEVQLHRPKQQSKALYDKIEIRIWDIPDLLHWRRETVRKVGHVQ